MMRFKKNLFIFYTGFLIFPLMASCSSSKVLKDQLFSNDPTERKEAVVRLADKGIHNRENVATLVKLATWEKDVSVRCAAIEAISKLNPELKGNVIDLYTFAINDSNVLIRRVAIASLQDLTVYPYLLINKLQKRLGDSDKLVRDLTMSIFERIGGMGVSMLLKALKDAENPEMRLSAVVTMGRIGPSARYAVPTLKKIEGSTSESNTMKKAASDAVKYITTNED
jgi:HEAT repeat protein